LAVRKALIGGSASFGSCLVQSDCELVNDCLKGQKRSFEVLIRRYERPVRAAALDVLGDYHRAQDASQEAFVRAWQKLPTLRKRSAFGPWLIKITRRCALNIAQRQDKSVQNPPLLAQAIEKPNGKLEDAKQRLLGAVMQLPKDQQQLIMLRYFSGQTVKETASSLDRSVGTITKQLSRAHKRLRIILERSKQ